MLTDEPDPAAVPGYRLLRKIGEGGMGVVYAARADGADGEPETVAVKVVHPRLAGISEYRRAFAREASAARRVAHPNVVAIVDSGEGEGGGPVYIVMRHVDGIALDRLVRYDRLSLGKALDITEQIAGALDAVHEEGLVHGDVSPANILLADAPDAAHALLTDFGLARPLATGPLSRSGGWARSGRGAGTPGFMAPETASGDRVTRHADVWSLCAVLCFLLTGRPPLPGRHRLSEQRDDLPRGLDEVVERALHPGARGARRARPHRAATGDRPAGRAGARQPRDRRAAGAVGPDRGQPPRRRLRSARGPRPERPARRAGLGSRPRRGRADRTARTRPRSRNVR
ncbi:serine/threonine-protein kinase [Actinomadura roseirufa]|uniref:serine/threonine-protein kinase n=1 Tax=Actinomadura roseirufa TaxID=2094049 RepID=UPI001040EC2C